MSWMADLRARITQQLHVNWNTYGPNVETSNIGSYANQYVNELTAVQLSMGRDQATTTTVAGGNMNSAYSLC